ncbi:2-C-methyl-D-erythritol 4-phosphate cytidylyltransferase [Candidatus Sumerlaeota bacterium]|nr:2-C-methyl-D-erythritol 4-phosphate cytidylyltransferase [Candidatus Sumerlaeota bacterium]
MKTTALIMAAGRGRRLGDETPKQFHRLMDKPLLNYCLEAFEYMPEIDSMIVVLPPEYAQMVQVRMDLKHFQKIVDIVAGGDRRQDSVWNGLKAIPEITEYVLIHDGVRPFPPIRETRKALEVAREFGAAILALPITDTVKVGGQDDNIQMTLDRSNLWAAQTPQIFRKKLLLEGYQKGQRENKTFTDDAAAVENLGYPVRLAPGSPYNIKITQVEDLNLAAGIFQSRKEDLD